MLKHRGWSICGLFIMATVSAICHHLFLNSYKGQRADVQLTRHATFNLQTWVSAWSIFLEKCTSFFLCSAIGLAFVALLWRRLRNTPFQPAEIDAAFSVPKNITAIVVLRKAPKLWVVTLVGIVVWLVPIASLTTPGSMTTMLKPWDSQSPYNVYVVDYERVPAYQVGTPFNDSWMLMDWDENLQTLPTPRFISEMPQLDNIARQVLAQQAFTPWISPCPGNCSFAMDLQVPALQCNRSDTGWMDSFSSCTNPTCFLFSSLYNSTAALQESLWENDTYLERDLWHLMWPNGSATCVLVNTTYPLYVTFLEKSNRPTIERRGEPTPRNLLADVMSSYNPDTNHQLDPVFWSNYHQVALAMSVAAAVGTTYADYYGSNDSSQWGQGGVMYQKQGIHLVSNQSFALAATFSHVSNNRNVPPEALLIMDDVVLGLNDLMLNTSMSLIGTPEFRTTLVTNCTVTTFVQAFSYKVWVLWRAYLPALIVGLGIVVAGAIVIQKGEATGTNFSDFATALKVSCSSAAFLWAPCRYL
jgi:hypothetical protein